MEEGAWVLLLVLHGVGASLARGAAGGDDDVSSFHGSPLFPHPYHLTLSPARYSLLSLYDTPLSYSIRTTEAQREPALYTLTAR